jgi:hypothetical protein
LSPRSGRGALVTGGGLTSVRARLLDSGVVRTEVTSSELAGLIISLFRSEARVPNAATGRPPPALPQYHRRKPATALVAQGAIPGGLNRTVAYFDGLLSNPSEARRLEWKVAL